MRGGPARQTVRLVALAGLVLASPAAPEAAPGRHVGVSLVPEVRSVRPGEAFWVGLRLRMDSGWHTYWVNPGDSGLPTRLRWNLPEGFAAEGLLWPRPERMAEGPLVSHGYTGEVLLLTRVTPPAGLPVGRTVTLAARADWVECREACLPGRAELSFALPVSPGPPALDPAAAPLFASARAALPAEPRGWDLAAHAEGRSLVLLAGAPPADRGPWREAHFFAAEGQVLDHAAPQALRPTPRGLRLELPRELNAARPPERLRGVLVLGAPQKELALAVDVPLQDGPAPPVTTPSPRP